MRNLDLKWHRTKLSFIRNRLMIIYGAFLFLWVFSFVLGLLLLGKIQDVVDRIEENQKATSCVLQIKRSDRTNERIADCVKNNSNKNKPDFQFNGPGVTDDEDSPDQQSSVPTPKLMKVYEPIAVVQTPTPEPPPRESTLIGRLEKSVNPVTNLLECRVLGDTVWQESDNCK